MEEVMGQITNDSAVMAALGRQMTRAVQKQAVAASNLANLDTPGYRTREIKFSEALDQELGTRGLVTTDPGHIGSGGASGASPAPTDARGLASRRDGNNVQLDRELLSLTRAGGEFNAAQTVLSAKFRLVHYAINDGR
jgi:flagellar basal-body rod protein FlgB